MLARNASDNNKPMRVKQASAKPNFLALGRCSGGSLLTAMEMKTRLSTPSTISNIAKVNKATHISELNKKSISAIYPQHKARAKNAGPTKQHNHIG